MPLPVTTLNFSKNGYIPSYVLNFTTQNIGEILEPTIDDVSSIGNIPIKGIGLIVEPAIDNVFSTNIIVINGTGALVEPAIDDAQVFPLNVHGPGAIVDPGIDFITTRPIITLDNESINQQNVTCSFKGDTISSITIPVSYLTTRLKQTGLSTVELTIPNGEKYSQVIEDLINDNGSFNVTYVDRLIDGTKVTQISNDYAIDTATSFQGGRNWSVNISGINTFVLGNQANQVNLFDVSLLRLNASGTTTIRCRLDRRLLPRDIAVYDSNIYSVENLTHIVQSSNIYMEISTN